MLYLLLKYIGLLGWIRLNIYRVSRQLVLNFDFNSWFFWLSYQKNQISCTRIHGFEEKSKFHVPGYMIFCFFFKSMYPGTWNFFDRTIRKIRNWNRNWVLIDGTPCILVVPMSRMYYRCYLLYWKRSILNSRENLTAPNLPLLYQTVIRTKVLTIQLIYSLQWLHRKT